jgi:hypothetical protein
MNAPGVHFLLSCKPARRATGMAGLLMGETGASDADGLFNFLLPVRTNDPLFEKPFIEAVASALY